jgi:hypothetical protein
MIVCLVVAGATPIFVNNEMCGCDASRQLTHLVLLADEWVEVQCA